MDNLYVHGQSRGVTKERRVARALEAHPEAYAAFRERSTTRPRWSARCRSGGRLQTRQQR